MKFETIQARLAQAPRTLEAMYLSQKNDKICLSFLASHWKHIENFGETAGDPLSAVSRWVVGSYCFKHTPSGPAAHYSSIGPRKGGRQANTHLSESILRGS